MASSQSDAREVMMSSMIISLNAHLCVRYLDTAHFFKKALLPREAKRLYKELMERQE